VGAAGRIGMKYYELTYDASYENEHTIGEYELGDFDVFQFLEGRPHYGKIPACVRLYVTEGDENLPQASLLANPLSWKIFSERLLQHWWPLIKDDIQVFDAPVYRISDGSKVDGYKLINPVRILDCIDWERSECSRYDNGDIAYFNKIFIDGKKARGHHLFRLQGYLYTLIVSDTLASMLIGTDFRGIAFIKCGTSPAKSTCS
jgi:hypothetical protein